ncbi:MAG: 1-acyl-sn-glycerol-3-phosphate acyltransferase [Puniceicoccaceae bacterium MED-G30]|nr:MAG: 1-acyl-sn-glycerol-3-phosphate acyltransferase [Puniceicoccaceae bacterium MED-G30]RPG83134.1 MAG: 1-acyl-sn-glycerol-3-phosphate acyltransferase [Coraliomargarita sp. TMED73]
MPDPRPSIPPLYEAVRLTADWFFSSLYDFTTADLKNAPPTGSVIFAANHVSYFDPPAIGCRVYRQIHYFARDTLFRGLFGKGLVAIGTIPVARENADVGSLKAIFRSLKKEGTVAIYPEGTRSPDGQLQEPKPGAGMIACKSRATVVPVRLFGTFEAYGRQSKYPSFGSRIHIAYGQPMLPHEVDPGKEHPDRYLEASRRIMERIAAIEIPEERIV